MFEDLLSEFCGLLISIRSKADRELSFIDDVILMVDGEGRGNRVQVKTELTSDLSPALADRIQVQQVLLNLIIKSIEAMSDVDGSRELRIKSQRHDNDSVHVTVQDSGPGFSSEEADKLFHAFSRLSKTG